MKGEPGRTARRGGAAAVFSIAVLVLAGCARFDDSASSPFTPEPTFGSGAEVRPREPSAPSSPMPEPSAPDDPCFDRDPNVVATCLDTTGGMVLLSDDRTALVAERRTGRILRVAQGTPPAEFARIPVDSGSDGGLLDIALSPTFAEDNLVYAYVTTPTDNRVVRIAPGDSPKDVLTGIPRGAAGNAGALTFARPGELLVLTGDAGNTAAAADPASLAGKLLRVTSLTSAPNPPRPAVALTGIGRAGDVCTDPNGAVWVTDRTAVEDRLQRVAADGSVGEPAWTWPDKPGVAGCAAGPGAVAVALTDGQAMAVLATERDTGAVTSAPALLAQKLYGRLAGTALGTDGQIWAATVNKSGGSPGPTDDRVVKLPLPSGGGGVD
ncbi:PQQ-dependent sugar dehydrogenase [Rhodococcus sp. SGAir0479]|uniref:PQQ-dependent sugar dehydrogenase n=1 Tax=Rhodococcus sp. SGAir0479 TaxID=2567884 RepID=UPI0010CCCE53|nr:PQQ-dependent sugar dehydrogenase [Rhodococcus sp. SGAir0479]QCQ91849.1 oxidoreductase [Rhodococcus sp. SGAir0479]